MKKYLTEEEAMAVLRTECRGYGAQRRLAEKAGVSHVLVNGILNEQRKLGGGAVPRALGLRMVTMYEVVDNG